jgi:hypothetical protein
MTEKNLSFQIQDGKSFFADEISITNSPTRIIMDFKVTTPRIDVRSQQGQVPLVIEHNTIHMDTHLAKRLHELLGEHLTKFEEKHGEIIEPEALTKARDKHEEEITDVKKPGYFG